MSSCPTNDIRPLQPSKMHIQILRIEVFKIAALAVDSNGYRVCLRLTSNRGYAWNEIFVDEQESPIKLSEWQKQLSPFVGQFILTSLTKHIAAIISNELEGIDKRPIYLFTNALHQLTFLPDKKVSADSQEEAILKKRAVAYFSI